MPHPPILGAACLLDVIGRPARHGEFLFVAALLDGPMGTRGHHLGDRLQRPDAHAFLEEYETLWVRARIGRVFGIAPLSPIGKHCLLDAAFLAIRRTGRGPFLEAYPFACTDSDGEEPVDYEWFDTRVGLAFGLTGPPGPTLRGRIADAFWGLLLSAPGDLATFGDDYESPFARGRVGCDGNDLFCDVEESDGPTLGIGFGGRWPCPDCDGEGIELFADLFEQACETCRGTGAVTWPGDDAT